MAARCWPPGKSPWACAVSARTHARGTLIAADGQVLRAPEQPASGLENHARPVGNLLDFAVRLS